ncbi:MAG: fructose PTS transporter subunit IIA [Atopobium sp.]|uniref:fructose PTS transporter subunit IIA n=1 Tax=Atopobium sp. TaxID=1872650 RepID=UPI002A821A78|nr:fructose PTS transporter subunit IIA [Atopobium sp.]MDY4522262.1 fructose PTS transporter subunit IIA [Atopobium sp.]
MALFSKNHMLGTLDVATQTEAFRALAARAQELNVTNSPQAIVSDYLQREAEASTGFGGGIAIPHARSASVLTTAVLFAKLKTPVAWAALDDKPVDTVISLLVPTNKNSEHLRLLSSLSRKLIHPEFAHVLKGGTTDEVYELIASALTGE